MRCYEQVRQYSGYMGLPVIYVGVSAGFGLTFFGNTHYALEDVSLYRSIPGMVVISPSDAGQAVKAMAAPAANVRDVEFKRGQVGRLIRGAGAVVIASQENCYMDLTAQDHLDLAALVDGGAVLVLMGDWAGRVEARRIPKGYKCDVDGKTARSDSRADSASYLLSKAFNWTPQQSTDSISPGYHGKQYSFMRQKGVDGTVFAAGPTSLSGAVTYYSAMRMSGGTVAGVPGARVLYRHGGPNKYWAGAWLASHGSGHVV